MSALPPFQGTGEVELFDRKIGNGPYGLGGRPGDRHPALIIAEIGINHGGDVDLAARMVDAAAAAGADVVKFQLRDLASCYGPMAHEEAHAPGAVAAYMPVLRKTALSIKDLAGLKGVAYRAGVGFLVTPFDPPSVAALRSIGVEAFKLASCDAVNPVMLDAVVATGKPFMFSTGMCSEYEVWRTVHYLRERGAVGRFVIMHTVSSYPCAFDDCQLHLITRYKHNHRCPVGWSGHERGVAVSAGAVALGADALERHFTLDRTLPGPDQAASIEPEGFRKMVDRVRAVERAYGDPASDRRRPRGEDVCAEVMRKSLYLARAVTAGQVLRAEDVEIRGPGRGLDPWEYPAVASGLRLANKDMPAGHALVIGDLSKLSPESASEACGGTKMAGGRQNAQPGAACAAVRGDKQGSEAGEVV